MNDGGAIAQFFFNVLPGGLLLVILRFYFGVSIPELESYEGVILLSLFFIFALLLGYIFQAVVIYIRQEGDWNARAIMENLNDKDVGSNDRARLGIVIKKIYGPNYQLKSNKDLVQSFYMMDSYLRGSSKAFLPTHLSSIFAIWSNLLVVIACIIAFFAIKSWKTPLSVTEQFSLVALIILSYICKFFANKFLRSYYSSILNAYFMATEIAPKSKNS